VKSEPDRDGFEIPTFLVMDKKSNVTFKLQERDE